MITPDNLKIKFLGILPILKKKIGFFSPQEIVAFSALLTFKGKSVQKLIKESLKKGERVEQKIKRILRNSSLRGHASLSTTPVICFVYEGSKFLDSVLTGMYFGSFLVSSGRRTDTTFKDIVYPKNILKKKKAFYIYKSCAQKTISFYQLLCQKGIGKDVSSKILQYGIYGTGIVQLPLESFISLKREYEIEKEWMPREVGILIKEIEGALKKLGVDLLYSTRLIAPRNTYFYPNIFKNPKNSNLVRALKPDLKRGFKIVSFNVSFNKEFKKEILNLDKAIRKIARNKKEIKKKWYELLLWRRRIIRDYNSAIDIKILSSVAWRVWGEKKRHRTCPQVVESIYYCIQRAGEKFSKFKTKIQKGTLNKKLITEIEKVFSIPPLIKNNNEFLKEYLRVALFAFESYDRLIQEGIPPRDAIFLIPRAVKIDVLQEYNLYNFLTGYYPLRLCQTAEEEMRRNTLKEVKAIKTLLSAKGYGWFSSFLVPKCHTIGFCPEQNFCAQIRELVKDYDEKFHQEMKKELEERFQKIQKAL